MMLPSLFTYSLLSFISISILAEGKAAATNAQIIPGRFIVEFHDGVHNAVESFFGALDEKGFYPQAGLNFSTHSVFSGCSFKVHEKTHPDHILALDMVKAIWPVRAIPAPRPKAVVKRGFGGSAGTSSHISTGVLDLHNKGIFGEGVVVGIIDTGIDDRHPAFKNKVLGGYNFGDNGAKPNDISDCIGQGTHAAGIIAGVPPEKQFISVAPKAKLRVYKIFGCNDTFVEDSLLIDALLKAYKDGVDVINLGISATGGWNEIAWQVVASNLVKKGVFVTMGAGISGTVGPWYAGGTGLNVLSVASIDNDELLLFPAKIETGNESRIIRYLDDTETVDGWQLETKLPVYATSTNISDPADACTTLPKNIDISNQLVLVKRGGCSLSDKAANVAAVGGQYLMFYNDIAGLFTPFISHGIFKHVGVITAKDGAFLVKSFAAGQNPTVSFQKGKGVLTHNHGTGGKASSFTQWGPSWEGRMTPEIAAPGGNILSTYLNGGYGVLSGTSMSAAYIAGIAALYYGVHEGRKNSTAVKLKERIISSGRAIDWNDGSQTFSGQLAPIAQIGGGCVNASKVLTYETSVSPAKLELNDTMFFKAHHTITVRNSGPHNVKYTVTHLPVRTFYTFQDATYPLPFPPNFVDSTASVKFSKGSFSIGKKTSESFDITFTPPQGLDEALLPVYGGKVVIKGSNGETLEVPYLGIGGSIKAQTVWGNTTGLPFITAEGAEVLKPRNLKFTSGSALNISYIKDWGSREIRVDVVTHDWQEQDFIYPPVRGDDTKFVGSLVTSDNTILPFLWESRHDIQAMEFTLFSWGGLISTDGKRIDKLPPGKYKINMRALKVFGYPEFVKDWQSFTSPVFTTSWG